MKKVEVILKVTDACNLRCKYCYNSERSYDSACLSHERFEKLLNVLLTGYNLIHIIWHGGEPLTAGLEYFERAMDIERKIHIQSGVVIENSIQTNGTLIDSNWIRFFKKYDFKVGISFDGKDNDRYRQGTEKTRRAMALLQDAGLRFGCNAVVADNSYDLAENYDFFKSMGVSFDFSPLIPEGGAKELPSFDVAAYAGAMVDLFDRWIYDTNGVGIRTFGLYLNLACGGNYRICSCCSCHMKYLSISHDGTVYNCGRDSMGSYPFGNIDDFESVSDIFESDGAIELISGSIRRREKCKESCEYFSLCAGGCADIAISEGGIDQIPANHCYLFKTVYAHVEKVYRALMEQNTPLDTLHPMVKSILARSVSKTGTTTKNEIADTYV